jgi:flagellar hook-basal body complex protein FliE
MKPVNSGSALGSEALAAARRALEQAHSRVDDAASRVAGGSVGPAEAERSSSSQGISRFADALNDVSNEVNQASPEAIAEDLLSGELQDWSEVAVRIRRADLSLRFSLQVSNKLVEAYREVMRMHV